MCKWVILLDIFVDAAESKDDSDSFRCFLLRKYLLGKGFFRDPF